MLPLYFPGGGKPVNSIPHHDVQKYQIRFVGVNIVNCLLGRPQGSQQLIAGIRANVHFKESPGDVLIIRHHDPDPRAQSPSPPFSVLEAIHASSIRMKA